MILHGFVLVTMKVLNSYTFGKARLEISMGFNLLKKDKASKATETVSLEKNAVEENEVQETQEENYSIVEEDKEALPEDKKVQVKDKKTKFEVQI